MINNFFDDPKPQLLKNIKNNDARTAEASFEFMHLSLEEVKLLAEGIKVNTYLTSLVLLSCDFIDRTQSLQLLAEAIEKNQTLTYVAIAVFDDDDNAAKQSIERIKNTIARNSEISFVTHNIC